MITADELRSIPLFAALPDDEAATARRAAGRRAPARGRLADPRRRAAVVLPAARRLAGSAQGRPRRRAAHRRLTRRRHISANCRSCSARPRSRACARWSPRASRSSTTTDFAELFTECETLRCRALATMTQRFAQLQQLAAETAPRERDDRRPSLRHRLPSPARFSRAQPDHVPLARSHAAVGAAKSSRRVRATVSRS